MLLIRSKRQTNRRSPSRNNWCAASSRNPNDVIEEQASLGNRVADTVARFGGSWSFILSCLGFLTVYVWLNISLTHSAWDPYPFIPTTFLQAERSSPQRSSENVR